MSIKTNKHRMKRIFTLCVACFLWLGVVAQTPHPVLVQLSGSGEITYAPADGFLYSHHTNYAVNFKSITVKWELSIMKGEPVVNGVYKWEAGPETRLDYLDKRDVVLLECTPKGDTSKVLYIKITPSAPKSGEGFGENSPSSPSWSDVFCTKDGNAITTKIPNFTAEKAKEIWRNGFYVNGVVLARSGGNDGYFGSVKVVVPSQEQLDEIQRQEDLILQNKEKYVALTNAYTLSVQNNDTVFSKSIRPVTFINPYFDSATVMVSIRNEKYNASTSSINTDVFLTPGENILAFSLLGKDINVTDTMRIFYIQQETFFIKDDFSDGVLDKKWEIINEAENAAHVNEENGVLSINYQRLQPRIIINGPMMTLDPSKKLIIEVKSLVGSTPCNIPNNVYVLINTQYAVYCRKDCNIDEQATLVCDLQKNTVELYINDELRELYENIDFNRGRGVQVGLSSRYSERWDIDEVAIYQ